MNAKAAAEVLEDEVKEIRKRRDVHRTSDSSPDTEPTDLTGLALSGGGIRAAAFALGFIQAMYRSGRMKAFDYLSTVSGGGYAGGLFSGTVARQDNPIDWTRNGKHNRLDFEAPPDRGQPETVERLALHGRMMSNFLRLFSRHLWGFLVNMTFAVSGLVAIAAVLAWFMRIPWNQNMDPVLKELKFDSDLRIPFFYTFLALLIWLASHAISQTARLLRKPTPPFTQYTYLLLLASVVLGVLTLLAIGDIDFGHLFTGGGQNERIKSAINRVFNWIGIGISGLLVTSLLPYLSPKRLLKSGDPQASRLQSIIFRCAGNALIIGAPLCVFFFLAHENISDWTSRRPDSDQLTTSHIASPSHFNSPTEFATRLESDTNSRIPVRRHLATRIYRAVNEGQTDQLGNELAAVQKFDEEKRITDNELGFGSRCLQWLTNALHITDQFGKRVKKIEDSLILQRRIVQRVNQQILSDPTLFVAAVNKAAQLQKQIEQTRPTSPLTKDGSTNAAAAPGTPPSIENAEINPVTIDHAETLLGKFGVAAKRSDIEVDDLERAWKSLMTANNQFMMRYVNSAQPKGDSHATDTDMTYALVQLARRKSTQRDDKGSAGVTSSVPKWFDGSFVFEMDRLLSGDSQTLKIAIKDQLSPLEDNHFESVFKGWHAKHALVVGELSRSVREGNWKLLHAIYPEFIRPQSTIFARVVNQQDQATRLRIAGYSFLIFLVVGLGSNLNWTSLHGVYRDQIAEIWLPNPEIRLHELETCSKGAPYHLINGTANRMGHRNDPDIEGRSRFLMSPLYCGTGKVGFRNTQDYDDGGLGVGDAIAISGAAVTSVNAPSLLQQLILFLTNFRLGQWLRNPQTYDKDHYWPSPIRALLNQLWHPEQRAFLFTSDGGHSDNTGLGALLQRRCRLMVCVDAGQDPNYEFFDILKVLHAGRAKYGLAFEAFDSDWPGCDILDALRPGEHDRSPAHFITFKITYPDVREPAVLLYSKLTVTGEEPLELIERARAKGHFPHDPTTDQFMPADVFESYVALGRHVGEEIDEYVCKGGIDEFHLSQGWHSQWIESAGEATVDDQPAVSSTIDADGGTIQTALESAAFDEAGVQRAVAALGQWCLDTLPRVAQLADSVDTSTLEVVSAWSREQGMHASIRLRRPFCTELVAQVARQGSAIKSHPTIRLHYCLMLEALGDRVSGVRQTLKDLSSTTQV